MAAPKGNQFWKLIDPDKVGRNPIFETPTELWEAVSEYFKECDSRPFTKNETTTSEKGIYYKVTEHSIPYTWEGLYVHLGVCNLDHYKTKEAFSGILTHIGNIIRNQKFSGAAAGIFNANIIARDLGLSEKTENRNDNLNVNSQELTEEQINKLLDKL